MNRQLSQSIVGCLQVSDPAEPSLAALRTFSRRDWVRTLDWLHLSGLALLFWKRLKDLGAQDAVPAKVGECLARNEAANSLRVVEMAREFDSINRLLEGDRIPYAVLKGFALIPEYFPDAALRIATDYDYLVSQDSLERAERTLQAAGYTRWEGNEAHSVAFYPSGRPARLAASLEEMYSSELPREVELHWKVWDEEETGIRLVIPEDFVARRILRGWQGLRFLALSDEDALTFHILHTLRHILQGWCRLASLFEIAYFLNQRNSNAAFWESFRARIGTCVRLRQAAAVILSLATGVFRVELPAALGSWPAEALTPAMKLWLERYGRGLALNNFSGNKFGLFLYRELVDDPAAWRAVQGRQVLLLKRPSSVAQAAQPTWPSRLEAGSKQLMYVLRLACFHLPASLRYGVELRRWNRMLRRLPQTLNATIPGTGRG